MVVGDAASLCDPFLAEGLRPALLSGVRAAEALDLWLGGDSKALAGYTATIRTPRGRDILAACGQLRTDSERLSAKEMRERETEERKLAQAAWDEKEAALKA